MANLLVDKRDVDFVLYEYFDILKLTEKKKFEDFSKEEFDMVLDQALKFSENDLAPTNEDGDRIGAKWEDGKVILPESFRDPLKAFGDGGWISAVDDPEVGGQGLPMVVFTAANEMFNAGNSALTLYAGLTHGASMLIEMFGTDEQKEKYLEKMYSFDWGGTMCLTEPGAGSDLAHVSTKAIKIDEKHYKIVGQKIFITGGDQDVTENIIHPVLARIEGDPEGIKGISIFIVPKIKVNDDRSLGGSNDVICSGIEHKMGIKGSSTCQLSFEDNVNCVGELLGKPGQGIMIMFMMMNEERLNVGIQALGLSSTAYLHALNYARERLQGTDITKKGKSIELVPIIEHPDIRRNLLWMKSYVEGLRALNYYAALYIDKRNSETDESLKKFYGGMVEFLTPICKAYTSDMSYEICEQAIQVYGGYGYCGDYPVEQYARDTKIASIYEGTNGIQAVDLVSRKLGMAKGEIFKFLVGEIEKTIDDATKNTSLTKYVNIVKNAKDNMVKAATHLTGLFTNGQVPEAFLSATPFLDIVGETLLGWIHLGQLVIAEKKLNEIFESKNAKTDDEKMSLIKEDKESAFYSGKVHSAKFFITKILPIQEAKVKTLMDDEFSALEIDDLSFGEEVPS